MNKFEILLCFLAISLSQSAIPEIDMGVVFDVFTTIMKGMSETSECKCANTLILYRDKNIPVLQEVWEDVRKGEDFFDALKDHTHELSGIDDIDRNCHTYEKIKDFKGIYEAKGIQQVGYNIIQNSFELEGLLHELINTRGIEGKTFVFGKILKTATGLSFS